MENIVANRLKVFVCLIYIFSFVLTSGVFAQDDREIKVGENSRTIMFGNQTRHYLLYAPAGYNDKTPLPLLVLLHGSGGSPKGVMELTGFSKVADEYKFIILAPDYVSGVDYEFIKEAVKEICSKLGIDKKRIYAAGFSLGAAMSSRLACDPSTGIAAIGVVAGLQFSWNCTPAHPVSVIAFHGTGDSLDKGMENYVSDWVELNGCNKNPIMKNVSENVVQISHTCKEKAEVVFFRINGGGHTWPDSPITDRLENSGIWEKGKTNKDINATNMIWSFFKAHPLP
jgi:polyhydroxybutyrate depolymerase